MFKLKFSPSTYIAKNYKLLTLALLGMGFITTMTLPVLATDVIYHGNYCSPNKNSVNLIERGQFGLNNTSILASAFIQCPFNLPFDVNLRVTGVYVTVYDRHPALNVTCTLLGVGLDGSTLWSQTTSSSGSGQSHQFLSFSPPNVFVGTMNMSCSLPPTTNVGASYVTTYRVITAP